MSRLEGGKGTVLADEDSWVCLLWRRESMGESNPCVLIGDCSGESGKIFEPICVSSTQWYSVNRQEVQSELQMI